MLYGGGGDGRVAKSDTDLEARCFYTRGRLRTVVIGAGAGGARMCCGAPVDEKDIG